MQTETMLFLFTQEIIFGVLPVWRLSQSRMKRHYETRERITNINGVNKIATADIKHSLQNF